MKRTSRRDPDYAFGQAMLTLRSAMRMTQAGLAELLGISRYALGDWEAGESYPKVEHFKRFIALAVRQAAFPAGHEAEEIRALWKLARQKVLLDEHWLSDLLAATADQEPPRLIPPPPPPTREGSQTPDQQARNAPVESTVAQKTRVDWDRALAVSSFYGRDEERHLLTDWILDEGCRVVSIVGIGGIGKSSLAVTQMHDVVAAFDFVIWRSLRDAPTCEALLDDCLQLLTAQTIAPASANPEQQINRLLDCLRANRVLLVLDNLETLLDEGVNAGYMLPDYESYGRMLQRIAQTHHQSCLLLTSREQPADLLSLEGDNAPVRTLRLAQLDGESCERLLAEKSITGSDSEKTELTKAYAGNPLALKIVSQTIAELFDGEITPFIDQGGVIFGGVRRLLDEQVSRLSPLEQDVLIWLAILREPSTLSDLGAVLVRPIAGGTLLETVASLNRRSLIERGQAQGSFTLQSVVLEYVTERLIATVSDEIEREQLDNRLMKHGLELAHTREYVRQIEVRLIVAPILARLRNTYSSPARLENHLLDLLKAMSTRTEPEQGYGATNLVVLLGLLRGNLRGVDLSHLVLRDLYLQGIEMQDARLVDATVQDNFFTEAFDAMTAVAISSTGEYWAAASRRGEIRIWEASGQRLRHVWRGHTDMTWTLVFSPNNQFLASGSNDGLLKLWDVTSGSLIWSGRHTSFVNRLSFSPDGRMIASAGFDARVCLWDVASGALLQTLPHPVPVHAVTFSPDGQLLATGDIGGSIHLWTQNRTNSFHPLRTIVGHTGCADGLAFAPDNRSLASASWDGTVKLWDITSGRLLQTLTGHSGRVGRVAWSPDGTTLASSGVDSIILLWDVERNSYHAALKGHSSHIYDIAFAPDSRSLLSSSRDGSLRIWDVASEQCVRIIHGYAASVYDVDWSPDSSKLISGGTDLTVTLWDVGIGMPVQVLQKHISVVFAVGWSPNGRWLASSETEYGIRLWDLRSGTDFRFLRHPDTSGNYFYGLTWSPDGQRLASGSHQHGVMIWDVTTGEEIWIGRQSETWFPLVAWSPDGTRLAGGGVDGSIYVWNVLDDTLERQFVGHQSRVNCLAWSPDGTRLASGASAADGGQLFVWDVQRGERSQSFVGHANVVAAVAWESDGEHIISGGGQGILRWWDVKTGKLLRNREAHDGAIHALRASPDGTKLASCGDDGVIMLWDIANAEHLQTLRRDRPYERLDITGIRGLTEAQKAILHSLGAIEDDPV